MVRKTVRVLLVDDHALVRSGIRAVLERSADIEVVAETGDGHAVIELVQQHHPDVVLMDIALPRLNGLEVTARITREFPGTRVVILSMHANEQYLRRAMTSGAVGYLMKTASVDELSTAVKAAAEGRTHFSLPVSKEMLADHILGMDQEADSFQRLTPREREVLQLIAEGNSAKKIAEILKISVKTVETHRSNLMNRLGIHDVAALVRYAIKVGLIVIE